jgi:hypothetical protein
MNVQSVLPKDAIPSIDDPSFGREFFGDPDDEVIVVDGDPPRAYPVRVLSYHEIVNDVVDGQPVAVTWCPICWSAAVYDRTVDGEKLTFGVSGKLADDALVMYDRETGSEWKQPTGVAIDGDFEGTRLTTLSGPMISWEKFTEEYPDGVVLQPVRGTDTGASEAAAAYDMAPYERYAAGEEFGLYGMRGEGEPRTWDRDDIDAKSVVLGIEHAGEAVAYPVERVAAAGGVVTDSVGGLGVVVCSSEDGVHAYENPGYTFGTRDGALVADGTTWDPETGKSEDGRRLDRVPARRQFAFAWQDAHGPDSFFQ